MRFQVPSYGLLAIVAAIVLGGCSSKTTTPAAKTDAEYRADVTTGVHDSIAVQLADLAKAAADIQSAAPAPKGRGWDAQMDAQAIQSMKDAWMRTRTAYEHVEGAVAPIFPDIDGAIDARYDDFLSEMNGKGDANLFDDQGCTGMHAIERILYAPAIPQRAVDFEKSLPGYKAAAFPATEQEAADFKTKLAAKLISDVKLLSDQWQPAKIDLGGAFGGLISLMNEQHEKVNKAATGEEESRYSQRTLADLHANLEGSVAVYNAFLPWVLSKTNSQDPSKDGPTRDGKIQAGFQTLKTAYSANTGDAIPQPPATWSSREPSAPDLQSPFGKLFNSVKQEVDPNRAGSIVDEMNNEARILGFAEFVEAP